MTQGAGGTHDREQGEGKQIYSESLINKRNPSWSTALLHSTSPGRHGSRSNGVLKKKTREVASFQHEPGKKIWKCLKRRQTSRDKVSNARDQ